MGVFRDILGIIGEKLVFPTHVGVFLDSRTAKMTNKGLPHARGGVSEDGDGGWRRLSSSPRTWGCFSPASTPSSLTGVFPTHVGVFLRAFCPRSPSPRLPHARGGVSASRPYATAFCQSSPRTWGCFCYSGDPKIGLFVFPTHVGVFPCRARSRDSGRCLPHARGGVSQTADTVGFRPLSSLRTWDISKKLLIAVY